MIQKIFINISINLSLLIGLVNILHFEESQNFKDSEIYIVLYFFIWIFIAFYLIKLTYPSFFSTLTKTIKKIILPENKNQPSKKNILLIITNTVIAILLFSFLSFATVLSITPNESSLYGEIPLETVGSLLISTTMSFFILNKLTKSNYFIFTAIKAISLVLFTILTLVLSAIALNFIKYFFLFYI